MLITHVLALCFLDGQCVSSMFGENISLDHGRPVVCQLVTDIDGGLCLALPFTSVFQTLDHADQRVCPGAGFKAYTCMQCFCLQAETLTRLWQKSDDLPPL